jgi:predicted RNA binding protein YcfA (HicA-like mRNA interferase family)
LLPPGKLIRKLKEVAGLEWVRSGGNHDIYRTRNGQTIPIPRHPGDLGRGLIRKILREAGVKMGLQEFMQQ